MSETILITGAAMRLGAALASDIAHAGGKARTVGCDLTNPANYEILIGKAAEAFGPLSALINNASQFRPDEADKISEAGWKTHFMMHVEAPAQLAAYFSRQLPAGRVGNIINMIDERVLRVPSKFFSYTLSKAALWTATKTMALHYAPRIRVNAIGPGPSLPERGQTEQAFHAAQRKLPLQRGPGLDEFTAAAMFFLSAPSVTGQMIALDGGRHLLGPDLEA